jgi:hypothetical protein
LGNVIEVSGSLCSVDSWIDEANSCAELLIGNGYQAGP